MVQHNREEAKSASSLGLEGQALRLEEQERRAKAHRLAALLANDKVLIVGCL
jgi:hypothetical protein